MTVQFGHPPAAATAGPPEDLRSMLWIGDRELASDLPPTEVFDRLAAEPEARAWVAVAAADRHALRTVAHFFNLDALAVEDLTNPREAPKLDTIERTAVIISAAVSFDPAHTSLQVDRISLVADSRAVVVVAADRQAADAILAVLRRGADRVRAEGIGTVIHMALDTLVDGYLDAVAAMQDVGDELAERLFSDRPLGKPEQLQAFSLRHALAALRRVCSPMVDVTVELANAAQRPAAANTAAQRPAAANTAAPRPAAEDIASRDPDHRGATDPLDSILTMSTARRFADLADHCRHAADDTAGLRDVLASAFETNLALADVHLNTIMKKLSGWAAIVAVPTLITGFMGMNVPYPGFGQGPGFYVALGVMIGAVIWLYVMFRRHDWI